MIDIIKSWSTHFGGQLLLIGLFLIILTLLGRLIFKSSALSFRLLIDPGASRDVNKKFFLFGAIQTIIGIVIIGALISVLTNKLITIIEDNRLHSFHTTIKQSFETNRLIRVRKLLSNNDIEARRRFFNLEDAEVRLEIGREDITKCIRRFGELRLRKMLNSNEVVVEDFHPNTDYGTFINRNSNLTIIATQNYGDACIGHFSYTIAENLDANYLSNEFFSSGSPLKSRHINFAVHNAFLDMSSSDAPNPLNLFIDDLESLKDQTSLFIYLSTGSSKRDNDIHIMFRGETEGNPFLTKKATYNDLEKLEEVYFNTKERVSEHGFYVGTHEDYAGDKPNHLPNTIFDYWGKETIRLIFSTEILWHEDEELYYEILLEMLQTIKDLQTDTD